MEGTFVEKMDEKREFPRIPAAAIVEIKPVAESSDREGVEVETLDMSAGGISFSTDRLFETGSRWNLTLRLDESLRRNPDWNPAADETGEFRNVTTVCEIVRIKGSDEIGYDAAARFVHIDDKDAASVQKFLAEL